MRGLVGPIIAILYSQVALSQDNGPSSWAPSERWGPYSWSRVQCPTDSVKNEIEEQIPILPRLQMWESTSGVNNDTSAEEQPENTWYKATIRFARYPLLIEVKPGGEENCRSLFRVVPGELPKRSLFDYTFKESNVPVWDRYTYVKTAVDQALQSCSKSQYDNCLANSRTTNNPDINESAAITDIGTQDIEASGVDKSKVIVNTGSQVIGTSDIDEPTDNTDTRPQVIEKMAKSLCACFEGKDFDQLDQAEMESLKDQCVMVGFAEGAADLMALNHVDFTDSNFVASLGEDIGRDAGQICPDVFVEPTMDRTTPSPAAQEQEDQEADSLIAGIIGFALHEGQEPQETQSPVPLPTGIPKKIQMASPGHQGFWVQILDSCEMVENGTRYPDETIDEAACADSAVGHTDVIDVRISSTAQTIKFSGFSDDLTSASAFRWNASSKSYIGSFTEYEGEGFMKCSVNVVFENSHKGIQQEDCLVQSTSDKTSWVKVRWVYNFELD